MRYRVKGLEIRTENAAKSYRQASRSVLNWIMSQRATHALDYGCGKLRYAWALAEIADRLTLVDSEIQLSRRQVIMGVRTSIREFVSERWKHARVLNPQEFREDQERYDLGLCANVLSAVPSRRVRAEMLTAIQVSLLPQGRCLFVTQYRNSYFRSIANDWGVEKYLDGWILKRGNRGYYYGILDKAKLEKLVKRYGFRVISAWVEGQSAFVLAGSSGNSGKGSRQRLAEASKEGDHTEAVR